MSANQNPNPYGAPHGPGNPGSTPVSSGPRHADPEDLTLFAMQLLTGEDASNIAGHIEHCAECRRELAHIHGDLAMLGLTVDVQVPAPEARLRLVKQVSREKKVIPISQATQPALADYNRGSSRADAQPKPRRNTGTIVLAWTGWAVAAGLAVAAAAVYKDREGMRGSLNSQAGQIARLTADPAAAHQILDAFTDPAAVRVTLTPKPLPPAPIGRTIYNAQKGTLIFLASKMEPLKEAKVYELWLIPADGKDPMPAGTFHPDESGNASLILPDLPKGIPAKAFGITIEDDGGSQTPTKPIIMAGS